MAGEAVAAATPPIEVRAALDLVVGRCGDGTGPPRGVALGTSGLVAELRRYGWEESGDAPLVLLGASPDEARAALGSRPNRAISVEAGPVAGLLRPLRAGGDAPAAGLPLAGWRALGYEPEWTVGVQGPGSLGWVVAGRLLRRAGRPDLADRCRLGMLRSLVASRVGRRASTVVVRAYRRGSA